MFILLRVSITYPRIRCLSIYSSYVYTSEKWAAKLSEKVRQRIYISIQCKFIRSCLVARRNCYIYPIAIYAHIHIHRGRLYNIYVPASRYRASIFSRLNCLFSLQRRKGRIALFSRAQLQSQSKLCIYTSAKIIMDETFLNYLASAQLQSAPARIFAYFCLYIARPVVVRAQL